MRLYRYINKQFGLDAIRDQRLKVSRYSQLNDTSELSLCVKGPTNKKHQRQQVERFDNEGGLICMSGVFNSPLMWGQYADAHKGVALIFDADPEKWHPVIYTSTRPTLEMFGKVRYRELSKREMFAVGMMKSEEWIYENERRTHIPLDDALEEGDLHFASFETASVSLVGVLFGPRAAVTDEDLKITKHLKVGFMKQSDLSYKIILDVEKTMRHDNQVTMYDLLKDVYENA
ncbi:conserved hypothetical protein [Agrobacterium deltaense NCPPB 1641]|uniref:DUF2971 domain-containing protein n=1 Tax=Agrobacterium deltaense NCPPB 1641 TaxID=1183425 RepID=A0A1S7U333_9HYPH|nr:conserved hypothetical protein [Agrobacterium deltaense NCPPB 1641]